MCRDKLGSSSEFKLEFPKLSRVELGHFNCRAETELDFFELGRSVKNGQERGTSLMDTLLIEKIITLKNARAWVSMNFGTQDN